MTYHSPGPASAARYRRACPTSSPTHMATPYPPAACVCCGEQGKDAVPFLEGLVVGDIKGLKDGTGSLSVFTNEKGGIIDDTVITKVSKQHSQVVPREHRPRAAARIASSHTPRQQQAGWRF
jgi:hypothetical protein